MVESFTTGGISQIPSSVLLREKYSISQSEANILRDKLRTQHGYTPNDFRELARGNKNLPSQFSSYGSRSPTKSFGSIAEEKKTVYFNNTGTTNQQQTSSPVQTVGVAVSGEDLRNFRQGFKSQGYNTAGDLLKGLREGKVRKKGGSYVVESNAPVSSSPQTPKNFYGVTDSLISKATKSSLKAKEGFFETKKAFAGHPFFTSDKKKETPFFNFKWLPVKDDRVKLSEQEYLSRERIKQSKWEENFTREKAINIFASPIKTVGYGLGTAGLIVGAGVSSVTEPATWSLFNKEKPVYSVDEYGVVNPEFSKYQHQMQSGQIGLSMFGVGITTVKPSGLTRNTWYEQDAQAFNKNQRVEAYTFQKPSVDTFGRTSKGFQPSKNVIEGYTKGEMQSQIYPEANIEPINFIKRENLLKTVLEKRGLRREGLAPNPKGEELTFKYLSKEELVSEVRYKNLLEVAKTEAKANTKTGFYQRELIEFSDPNIPTPKPKVTVETTRTFTKPRILVDKKGSYAKSFQNFDSNKVFKKSLGFDTFRESFKGSTGLKNSKLNSVLNPTRPAYDFVIVPNTQLSYWNDLSQKDVVVEERKSTFTVKEDIKSKVITYAKITPKTSTLLKQDSLLKQNTFVRSGTVQRINTSQKLNLGLESVQNVKQKQIQLQAQDVDTVTITVQDTFKQPNPIKKTPVNDITRTGFDDWTTTPPPPPPPIDFKLPSFSKSSRSGFVVSVRKRGKFETVASNVGLKSAYKLAKLKVGNTASASFKLTPLNSRARSQLSGFSPNKDFYKSKTEDFTFIERRSRRIKSSGELREITFKGIATQKKKKKKNFWGL